MPFGDPAGYLPRVKRSRRRAASAPSRRAPGPATTRPLGDLQRSVSANAERVVANQRSAVERAGNLANSVKPRSTNTYKARNTRKQSRPY